MGSDENTGLLVGAEAKLETSGEPINIPPRRIHAQKKDQVRKELERLMKAGIVAECQNSPWNSPLHPVLKKNGRVRLTVDFKQSLNRRLCNLDPYPLEPIDSLFDRIEPGTRYFSSVDLWAGYFQVKIREQDQPKTAFYFEGKCYMFQRLPMGLTDSGAQFSRLVAKALKSVTFPEDLFVYLDDLSVMSKTFDKHYSAVKALFEALDRHGLRVNPAKCNFLAGEQGITVLGRRVTPDGVRPDLEFVSGVQAIQSPRNRKELLSLQGRLVWVKNWIGTRMNEKVRDTNFSQLCEPILKAGRDGFQWTDDAEKALSRIKRRLSSAPFISYSDPSQPFLLVTDASSDALGAILLQVIDGEHKVVGLHSRIFNSVERRWSPTERELFAIKDSCAKFDHFLRFQKFVVQTDHRALCWLDSKVFNNDKCFRLQQFLMKYSFVVQYIPGKDNQWADWLSRPPVDRDSEVEPPKPEGEFLKVNQSDMVIYVPSWVRADAQENFAGKMILTKNQSNFALSSFLCRSPTPEVHPSLFGHLELAQAQFADSVCKKFILALEAPAEKTEREFEVLAKSDDKFCKTLLKLRYSLFVEPGTRLLMIKGEPHKGIVPPSKIARMLRVAHSPAHLGRDRTLNKLTDGHFWWPKMSDDVATFVDSCWTCARRKGNYGKKKPPPGAIDKGSRNFGTVYCDYVHMPEVKGFKYLLTVQCGFTRFLTAFPTRTNTAKETAFHLSRYFLRHGVPDKLSSDRGVHFANAVIEELCSALKIEQKVHTAWRPQSTGSLERVHRTLKASLFCTSADNGNTWLDNLDFVVATLNGCSTEHRSVSPYFLVFGQSWNGFTPTLAPSNASQKMGYGRTLVGRIQRLQKLTKVINETLDRQNKSKQGHYQKPHLVPNDLVLIHRPQSVEAKSSKLDWVGPYRVLVVGQLTAKLQNPKNEATDWVSLHHIRKVPPRPSRLEEDSLEFCESEGVEHEPAVPLSPPKVVPKTSPNSAQKLPKKTDSLSKFFSGKKLRKRVNQSKSLPIPSPRQAQSSPTPPPVQGELRRSSRQRRQPDRLTYASVARG